MFLTDPSRAHPVIRAARAGVSLLLCLQFSSVFTLTLEARSFVSGATPSSAAASGGDASAASSSSGAALAQQVQSQRQSLVRATQVLQAMQQAQAAARTLALQGQSAVPNGLGAGGLQVAAGVELDPSLWQGALAPVQSSGENGRLVVKIDQETQKAILTWDSFNVGRETDLVFDQQGNADWLVLNRVTDAQASPSKILGTLKADGSVYVINRNGVIFGGASQVNVHTLVASSLSLTNEQFMAGINTTTVIPDASNSGNNKTLPIFGDHTTSTSLNVANAWSPTEPAPAGVTVEAGAQLTAADGGKIMLFGTSVENAGTLSALNGQVILAAGEQVWLATDLDGVRGLDVAVSGPMPFLFTYGNQQGILGANSYDGSFLTYMRTIGLPALEARAEELGYNVTNTGLILSEHGDVTLQSREVLQDGVILATTALNNQNGSIRLRAWYQGGVFSGPNFFEGGLRASSLVAGTVTLGEGSLTSVLPDFTDTREIETTALATRYAPGSVTLDGKLIELQKDSHVVVPAGVVEMVAAAVPTVKNTANPSAGPGTEPGTGEVSVDGSRIYIDEGAVVSVAGLLDMLVDLSRNFVEVDVRINELRDSPVLKDTWIYGETVLVDRRESGVFESGPMSGVEWGGDAGEWQGTPLADVSAWIGVGVTDLQELSSLGGSITIKTGGDLITRAGSLLEVSGGSVRYSDGWNLESRLLGADGNTYRISEAPSDIEYVGWAGDYAVISEKWGVTTTYHSPMIRAKTYEKGYTEGRDAGSIQIYAAQGIVLEGAMDGGVVTGERQVADASGAAGGSLTIGGNDNTDRPWLLGELIITDTPTLLAEDFTVEDALGTDFYRGGYADKTTWLDADTLGDSGLTEVTLYLSATDFTLESGTVLELTPGTSLLIANNMASSDAAMPVFTLGGKIINRGGSVSLTSRNLVLPEGAGIDVSGQWINEWLEGAGDTVPVLDGGSIALGGDSSVSVDEGVSLDVSGGGLLTFGSGNAPSLNAGDAGDIRLGNFDSADLAAVELSAFAAGTGGALTLNPAGSVQIGGVDPQDGATYYFGESLFSDRGFSAVSITASGDLTIADGAQVGFIPLGWDTAIDNYTSIAGGSALSAVLAPALQTAEQRLARDPASLSLTARGDAAQLLVGLGASLRVDTAGSVSLAAERANASVPMATQATVLGRVEAPAGSITVKGGATLHLADGAVLDAAGTSVIYTGKHGLLAGDVLDGGSVTLDGVLLNLDAGSLIDVSGAAGTVQYMGTMEGKPAVLSQSLASDGGSILIGSAGGAVDATLRAFGGGAGASGGSLTIVDSSQNGESDENLLDASISSYLWYQNAAGTFVRIRYSDNLDILDEYEGDVLMDSTMRNILGNEIPKAVSATSGLILTGRNAADVSGTTVETVNVWEYDSTLDEHVVALLNEHFWNGSSRAVTTKISIGQITLTSGGGVTVSAPRIQDGGFSRVVLNSAEGGLRLDDGVHLDVAGSLGINTGLIRAYGDTVQASLTASFLSMNPGQHSAAAVAPGGVLEIAADVVEVETSSDYGMDIIGFAETVITTGELRFNRNQYSAVGSLHADGALTIAAGRIYPGTATEATISAASSITILDNGERLGAPLSAGGSLTLEAPVIDQSGVLYAPFGRITLKAGTLLTLGAGSLTSVSGDGLQVPYGRLANDEYWLAPYTLDDTSTGIAYLPDKSISLDAPTINTAAGAVIDIRGGGDLYAGEFVPGTGGSHDILALSGAYAVIPDYASIVAPADGTAATGQRVWLAGGNGLAAGWYTLLPASYAALPGAYLVINLGAESVQPMLSGNSTQSDSSVVMNGRLGNALDDSVAMNFGLWQVMTSGQLRQYSEYNENTANAFFASDAFKLTQYRLRGVDVVTPALPRDAGSVVLKATETLVLDGTLLAQAAADGRGGNVDIAAQKIAIVGTGAEVADLEADSFLILDAEALTDFGAGSLLLGGTRSQNDAGTGVGVVGTHIVLRNDADSALSGSEIILAGTDTVEIEAGSVLLADADAEGSANDLIVTGGGQTGALVRVSGIGAVQVLRTGAQSTSGTVVIGEGAVLSGGASLLIDATRTTELAAGAQLGGAAISVAAAEIGLGGGSGLVLDPSALAQLSRAEVLTLHSYGSINVHGNVDFRDSGLNAVVLDAAVLSGYAGDVYLKADTLALTNSGAEAAPADTAGGGILNLEAGRLELGEGGMAFEGFSSLQLTGRDRIVATGDGVLDAGTIDLRMVSSVLTGENAASYTLVTQGALSLSGGGELADDVAMGSLGSVLALEGGTVEVGGNIVAMGGAVSLLATGGDLTLSPGARVDVGGVSKDFYDVAVSVDAGRIRLQTTAGDILVGQGARLDLSADSQGGAAGELVAETGADGVVTLDGVLSAHGGATGQGGSFSLDTARLDDFAGLGRMLTDSGFDASRSFRVRTGDVTIDGSTSVADFSLSADLGRVTISGGIEALATYGGGISVSAGEGIVMTDTALLRAGATDDELGSGRVTLDAGRGSLDLRGGAIDVSGGEGGRVRLRALRDATNDGIAATSLAVAISGANSAVLEGVAVYESESVDAVRTQAVADAHTFASHAAALETALGNDAVSVMAGIEIRSGGDLTLESDWNLFGDFGADERMGGLTLRAAGDLLINANLSDGFSAAGTAGVLQTGDSWDLRLVAGADLSAADRLAVLPLATLAADRGSVIVGNAGAGQLVRTGSGDLSVAAGRDLHLAHANSAIYTAGKADTTVWDDFETVPATADFVQGGYQKLPDGTYGYPVTITLKPLATAAYGIQGGNMSIDVQSSVTGAMTNYTTVTVFDWLRRLGRSSAIGAWGVASITDQNAPFIAGEQSTWFVDYARFNLGVGALGGGSVSVAAGGDISNILVAQPTNGRVRGGRTEGEAKVLELRNGGSMSITAGGAILGGQYYLGRGEGVISATEFSFGTGGYAAAPVLALGDADMTVTTAGDLLLQTVIDPLLRNILFDNSTYVEMAGAMSGYTADTELNLLSVGGDVTLGPKSSAGGSITIESDTQDLYPVTTRITAFGGDMTLASLYQLSGYQTELVLLAADDLNPGTVVTGRITPEALFSPYNPMMLGGMKMYLLNETLDRRSWPADYDTDVDWTVDDHEPSRIYALSGNVNGGSVRMGEALWLRAGNDIRHTGLNLRNNHAGDVSLVEAGNDILGMLTGNFGSSDTVRADITIQGPGDLLVLAGRDVYNLNVQSLGNYWQWSNADNRPDERTLIPHLASEGASISVMAGINSAVNYEEFAAAYLDIANIDTMAGYLVTTLADGTRVPLYWLDETEIRDGDQEKITTRGLVSFIEETTGETLAPAEAWVRFQELPELTRQVFLRRVFLQELREAGRDQNTLDATDQPLNGGYNRGYAAIETLFPGDSWDGDVVSTSMSLRTMLGGDVNVFTPGGKLQVAALTAQPAAGQGLITLAGGHVGIFASDSVEVNRSRVLTFVPAATLRGSDMIIWSTDGDVDAGRGAKTVRVASGPIVETDADAYTTVFERSDMSGSGIGTVGDGDVDLIAPRGTVNAGDAGIRVAGNLNIAALRVLNIDNIEVEGIATGIPVVAAPNIAAITVATSVAGAASNAAAETARSNAPAVAQPLPTLFKVEMIGYGPEAPPPADEEQTRASRPSGRRPVASEKTVASGTPVAAVFTGR